MAQPELDVIGAMNMGDPAGKQTSWGINGGPGSEIPFAYNTCPTNEGNYGYEQTRVPFRVNDPEQDPRIPSNIFYERQGFESFEGADEDPRDPSTCRWKAFEGPGRAALTTSWHGGRDFYHNYYEEEKFGYPLENLPRKIGDLKGYQEREMYDQYNAQSPNSMKFGQSRWHGGESIQDPIEMYERALFGRKYQYRDMAALDDPTGRYIPKQNREIDIDCGSRCTKHHPTGKGSKRPDVIYMRDEASSLSTYPTYSASMTRGQIASDRPVNMKVPLRGITPYEPARGHSQHTRDRQNMPSFEQELADPWRDALPHDQLTPAKYGATQQSMLSRQDVIRDGTMKVKDQSQNSIVPRSAPNRNAAPPGYEESMYDREAGAIPGVTHSRHGNYDVVVDRGMMNESIKALRTVNETAAPYEVQMHKNADLLDKMATSRYNTEDMQRGGYRVMMN